MKKYVRDVAYKRILKADYRDIDQKYSDDVRIFLGNTINIDKIENWHNKALKMSKELPKRGDLLFPYLSYAINNNKSNDAAIICESRAIGIEAFCDLIFAYQLLKSNNIDQQMINTNQQT